MSIFGLMKVTRQTAIAVIVLTSILLMVGGAFFLRAVLDVPRQAYAMWGAGDLLICHLKLNTNNWPKNWDDLEQTVRKIELYQPAFKTTLETNGPQVIQTFDLFLHSSFDQIQKRVVIDWNASVADLAKATFTNNIRPFQVVRLRNGTGRHYVGAEPNVMIWEYLQSTKSNLPPVWR